MTTKFFSIFVLFFFGPTDFNLPPSLSFFWTPHMELQGRGRDDSDSVG